MAKGSDVLEMLIPTGGWVCRGDSFADIEFIDCEPITKKEFEAGFAKYDAWKVEQDAAKATQKNAILERLGITEDEARLILE
jgi:hypothetical protein